MIQLLEKNYDIKPNPNFPNNKNDLINLRNQVQEYRKKYNKRLEKLKKYLCKISYRDIYITGFFASIPYKTKSINVLITNNNIINEKYLAQNKSIEIYFYDEEKKIINLDNKRISYSSKEFDISIIEIKDTDKINNFIQLDNEIIKYFKYNKNEIINNCNNLYKK